MSRVSGFVLSLALLSPPAFGQAVVSTHSGVVHFFEGAVSVAGQPLEARFGKFAAIPEGGELRTELGRAEVLLTPGVFLRIGEKSAIRLLSDSLADTRVEVLAGSVILESAEPADGTSVTLIYKDWKIAQAHQGAYRIDSDPPRLQVRDGEVKVAAANDAPVLVAQGMDLPFQAVLVPERSNGEVHDTLSEWADGRDQSISADNAIAADIQDPATMSSNPYGVADSFTYFPMLGYPGIGTYSSVYGNPSPLAQPGFYSIYLPGYTYRPLYLRLPNSGLGRSLYLPTYPSRTGTGLPVRLPIGTYPIGTHPITSVPGARPVTSVPVTGVRPAPAPATAAHPVGRPGAIHK